MQRRGALIGLVAAVVLAGVGAGPTAADEPATPGAPGAELVEVCVTSPVPSLPTIGPDACATLEAVAVLLAVVCGNLPVDPAACADLSDGRPIEPAAVDAFAAGWVPRALRLQALLSEDRPLRDDLIPHTHNSFNAPQYGPTLTTSDPNQRFTLTDQLRMGIRAVELDVHWLPSLSGTVASGGYAVTVCHGQTEDLGGVRVHVGCTVDRPLGPFLDELAAYLRAPGNEREVLLLYLQNELDGTEAGHAAASALLEEHLGDLIARPPAGRPAGECADLPVERSRADLLAEGHRVLVTGNCGPGPWSSLVFQRGDGWDERGNSAGYPAFPDCAADRTARAYDQTWIRVTEDRTWLSAIAASPAPISRAEVQAMVRCGVELVGLDRIGPADPRLADLVWSWAPDEPAGGGHCAAWGTDARFRSEDCAASRRAACRTGDGWVLSTRAVPWAEGPAACALVGARFEVPRSAWENEQLRTVAAQAAPGAELWLGLAESAASWRPGGQPLVDAPAPAPSGAGRELPATGGPSAPTWVLLVALAVVAGRAAAARDR